MDLLERSTPTGKNDGNSRLCGLGGNRCKSKELLVQEAIEYSPSDDLAASMIDLRIRDIERSQTSFTQASPAARRAGCS